MSKNIESRNGNGYREVGYPYNEKLWTTWCDVFTQAYGYDGHRTYLEASHYIMRVNPSMDGCQNSYHISYTCQRYSDDSESARVLEGLVVGATMIRIDHSDRNSGRPYLMLEDAHDVMHGTPITAQPNQRIYVPLSPDVDSVTLV